MCSAVVHTVRADAVVDMVVVAVVLSIVAAMWSAQSFVVCDVGSVVGCTVFPRN